MIPALSRNQSFRSLLGAQFLGHLNDNLFKMVVSLMAVETAQARAGFYVSLASVLVVLPYLVFSGYAGYLADIASKRTVMILCKVAEIIIMAFGLIMLTAFGTIEGLLFVLFLVAAHETFFSPSKYGAVPELVDGKAIVRANGMLEASRYVAIIVGTGAGGLLMEMWSAERYRIGLAVVAIALAGLLLTRRIKRLAPAGSARSWPRHPWSTLPDGLRRLSASRALGFAVASITFFESTATLVLLDALLLAKLELGFGDAAAGALGGFAAIGCGAGALICGRVSGQKVELGLVPLAGLGLSAMLLALSMFADGYWTLGGMLFALGVCGGVFFLPCLSWLQKSTRADEKGLILSTNNMLSMLGVLSASLALFVLHDLMGLSPSGIFLFAALLTALWVLAILASSHEFRFRAAETAPARSL